MTYKPFEYIGVQGTNIKRAWSLGNISWKYGVLLDIWEPNFTHLCLWIHQGMPKQNISNICLANAS